MLDLISWGAQGHGPVHILLISAAELGFAWSGAEKGWVRVSLPSLRFSTLLFWMPGVLVCSPSFPKERAFWAVCMLILKALYNYLPRPTWGNEIKCC